MIGITGILRPNGIFVSCDYGSHCTIAVDIPKDEDDYCIYFSSSMKITGNAEKSIIYFCNEITINQLIWIIKNNNKFDKKQLNIWKKYIKDRIIYGKQTKNRSFTL